MAYDLNAEGTNGVTSETTVVALQGFTSEFDISVWNVDATAAPSIDAIRGITSGGAVGVYGRSDSDGGVGVRGQNGSGNGDGVQGFGSGTYSGVAGFGDPASNGTGVFGQGRGEGAPGVRGIGAGGPNTVPPFAVGVYGQGGDEAPGVVGQAGASPADGVQGFGSGTYSGVAGFGDPASNGTGVFGQGRGEGAPGVRGIGAGGPNTVPPFAVGVYGQGGDEAPGVQGVGSDGEFAMGVYGVTTSGIGGWFQAGQGPYPIPPESSGGAAVGPIGIIAQATLPEQGSVSRQGFAVVAQSTGGTAVLAESSPLQLEDGSLIQGYALQAIASDEGTFAALFAGEVSVDGTLNVTSVTSGGNFPALHVDALAGSTTAGLFDGDVTVNGTLTATGAKNFLIDHPLDPTNKYLAHASVESSEQATIYSGNTILDDHGEAVVNLPAWVEALNDDFRYQLTCIGRSAPVYVADEVADSHFRIAGGPAGLKVSWQLTGIRKDAWAKAHPLVVEQDKPNAT